MISGRQHILCKLPEFPPVGFAWGDSSPPEVTSRLLTIRQDKQKIETPALGKALFPTRGRVSSSVLPMLFHSARICNRNPARPKGAWRKLVTTAKASRSNAAVTMRPKLTPSELMKACGSEKGSFEPEARDQWKWMLKFGEGPERALAWIKLKSIANNSPFCVDEAGVELRVASMAADLGWEDKTASNVCTKLVEQGRVRLSKGRIYYRADVPENPEISSDGDDQVSRVHGNWPTYLLDFIRSLPEHKRMKLEAAKLRFEHWTKKAMAEGVAALRSEVARVELNMYRTFGAPKISLPRKKAEKSTWGQISLFAAPDFVHGNDEEFVQTGSGAVYTGKSTSVQSGLSLLSSDSDADKRKRQPNAVSQSVTSSSVQDRPTDPIKALLLAELGKQLPGEVPSKTLLERIDRALGAAPLENLAHRIRTRLKSIESMGMVEALAKDVAKAWEAQEAARLQSKTETDKRIEDELDGVRLEAKRVLTDPNASAEERQLAQEILGAATKAVGGRS